MQNFVKSMGDRIIVDFSKISVDNYYNEISNVLSYINSKYGRKKGDLPIYFESYDVDNFLKSLWKYLVDVDVNGYENVNNILDASRKFFVNDFKWYFSKSLTSWITIIDFLNRSSKSIGFFTSNYFINDSMKFLNWDNVEYLFNLIKTSNKKVTDNYVFPIYYGGSDFGIMIGAGANRDFLWFNNVNIKDFKKNCLNAFSLIGNNKELLFLIDQVDNLNVIGAVFIDMDNNTDFYDFFLYNNQIIFDWNKKSAVVDEQFYENNKGIFDFLKDWSVYKYVNINDLLNVGSGNYIFDNKNFVNKFKPDVSKLSDIFDRAYEDRKTNINTFSIERYRNFLKSKYRDIFMVTSNYSVIKNNDSIIFKFSEWNENKFLYHSDVHNISDIKIFLSNRILDLIDDFLKNDKNVIFNFDTLYNENNFHRLIKMPLSFYFSKGNKSLFLSGNLKNGILIDGVFVNAFLKKAFPKHNIDLWYYGDKINNFLNDFFRFVMKVTKHVNKFVIENLC